MKPSIESKNETIRKTRILNEMDPGDSAAMQAAIEDLFAEVGEDARIYPGFHCDNGFFIRAGSHLLINYNVTILDWADVTLGDWCKIGPGVCIATVNHDMDPIRRRDFANDVLKPVTVGNDVWIGANATLCPGVTIGDNVIVAGGAVVTKDIPSNTVVGGVPAKVLRENPPKEREGEE